VSNEDATVGADDDIDDRPFAERAGARIIEVSREVIAGPFDLHPPMIQLTDGLNRDRTDLDLDVAYPLPLAGVSIRNALALDDQPMSVLDEEPRVRGVPAPALDLRTPRRGRGFHIGRVHVRLPRMYGEGRKLLCF